MRLLVPVDASEELATSARRVVDSPAADAAAIGETLRIPGGFLTRQHHGWVLTLDRRFIDHDY